MEKPRKKECYIPTDEQVGNGAYYDLRELEGYNNGIADMSTWLVGQVPTVREIRMVLDQATYRNQAEAIHALITRKLRGSEK